MVSLRRKFVISFRGISTVKQKYVDHFLVFEAIYNTSQVGEREFDSLRETLNRTFKELPSRCQDVVRMRIDEELSNEEIALRMNIKKSSVRRYMTEALIYFKKMHPKKYKDKPIMKVEEEEYPYRASIEGVT